jgi:hypothetical protein
MADVKPSAEQLSQEARDEDMDESIETEIVPETQVTESMNMDSTNDDALQASGSTVPDAPVAQEARIPAKKDANLKEFLGKMDDYAPIVRPLSLLSCAPVGKISANRIHHRSLMRLQTTSLLSPDSRHHPRRPSNSRASSPSPLKSS